MRSVVLVILLFFFIYNIPFSFLPIATGKIVLLVSFLTLIFSLKSKLFSHLYLPSKVTGPFFLIIILIFYSLSANLFHRTQDYTALYTYVIFFVEYFLGTFLLLRLVNSIGRKKQERVEVVFFKSFIIIAVIQSFLVYFMLFIPSFKQFSFSILKQDDLEVLNTRYGGFRGLGYASSLTYDFSVLQSLALLLIPYQLIHITKSKIVLCYLLAYLLIMGSVFVSGRTGMIGIGISLLLFVYFSTFFREKLSHIKKGFSKFWKLFIFLSLLLTLYYLFFIDLNVKAYIEDVIVPYTFEAFINYVNRGSLETNSTNILQRMYFPISFDTFIWGDGYYRDPSGIGFYMSTDAGYMRQILFYGIFGSIILYTFYMILLLKVFKTKIRKELKVVFLSVIIYLFFVQYKGDIMMGGSFVIKFVILFYLAIQLNNTISEKRKINICNNSN